MNILQVCGDCRGGGAGRIAYALHQGYLARGHESWLAVGFHEMDAPGVVEIPALKRAFSILRLASWLERWIDGTGKSVKAAWRLRPVVSHLRSAIPRLKWRLGMEDFDFPGSHDLLDLVPTRPDVLHLHNLHGGYFDLRTLPALCSRLPVGITMHDEWLLTGHCAYSLDCMRWKADCGKCPHLDSEPSLGRDGTARNWKRKKHIYGTNRFHVVTPSQWLMDRVQQSMFPVQSSRVIPNGVDQAVFSPGDKQAARTALGLPIGIPMILYVAFYARTNPYKDYALIEAAMRQLGGQTRGEVRCVCVGEAGESLQFGEVRVEFVGHLEGASQLVKYYQAADIAIHAAKADTFPTTILEAMSCGLPVVATDVGGVSEQVIHGSTGYLVPPGNVTKMAEWLQYLLDQPLVAEQMGNKAAGMARKQLGFDMMVDRYLDWYGEILCEKNR